MHNASRDHALGAERCIYATDAALASLSSCACVLNSGDGKWTCARGIASDAGIHSAATQWPSAMAVRAAVAITMTYEPGRGSTPRRAEPTTSRVSWGRYLLSVLDEQWAEWHNVRPLTHRPRPKHRPCPTRRPRPPRRHDVTLDAAISPSTECHACHLHSNK